jgi:hypothetical protein
MLDSIRAKLTGMLEDKIGQQFKEDILSALKSGKIDGNVKKMMRQGQLQLEDNHGRPILQK